MRPATEKYIRNLIRESFLNSEEPRDFMVSDISEDVIAPDSEHIGPISNPGREPNQSDFEAMKKAKEQEIMNSLRNLLDQYFEDFGPMQS